MTMAIDDSELAATYARHRRVQPEVFVVLSKMESAVQRDKRHMILFPY